MGKWLSQIVIPDFSERSTWRGVLIFLSLIGVHLAPEFAELIINAGIVLYGLFLFLRDRKKPKLIQDVSTQE